MYRLLLLGPLAASLAACSATMGQMQGATSFTVRVQDVSTPTTLATPGGPSAAVPVPLSPGVWVVHGGANPIWTAGAKASNGVERIAEDGDPTALAAELKGQHSGVFNTPVGASAPGPLMPGDAYEFTVSAKPGDRLSFETMFVQSNDLFYDFSGAGLNLFDSAGHAVSGDVTPQVVLLDAGTEVNEQPGVGPNQKPRQPANNVGPSEDNGVGPVNDGYVYPVASSVIKVTVTPSN